jgi:hypothetical protein
MLPNFLIVGSQKAGTTSLHGVLEQHQDVFMSPVKEINFFSRDDLYRKGLGWYEDHFAGWEGQRAVGEASPGYIVAPQAPERISVCLRAVKLVLTVRNPVDRAYSQYWHSRRNLAEHRSFATVVREDSHTHWRRGLRGYISRGIYAQYIRQYLRFFSQEQLLILVFEDLILDPQQFYSKLFTYLGIEVPTQDDVFSLRYNRSTIPDNPVYRWLFSHPEIAVRIPKRIRALAFWGGRIDYRYPPMEEQIRESLNQYYAPHNAALRTAIEHPLPGWS